MRRLSAILVMLLTVAGCAVQPRPAGELAAHPAPRTIIGIEVTNTFTFPLDVYYGGQFLGTLAVGAHRSFTVPPVTVPRPIYGRMTGDPNRAFNLSRAATVRYVYAEPPAP